MIITIEIDDNTIDTIKRHYDIDNNEIIKISAQKIIDAYLHIEYLDAEKAWKDEVNKIR